jgi:hypothetical protein
MQKTELAGLESVMEVFAKAVLVAVVVRQIRIASLPVTKDLTNVILALSTVAAGKLIHVPSIMLLLAARFPVLLTAFIVPRRRHMMRLLAALLVANLTVLPKQEAEQE